MPARNDCCAGNPTPIPVIRAASVPRGIAIALVATLAAPAMAATPVAPPIAPQQITEGLFGGFAVPAFSDADGDALTYSFTGLPAWFGVYNTAANPRYLAGTPPYSESGSSSNRTYWITATATDPGGASASKAFSLTILNANAPPTRPAIIPPQVATEGSYFGYTVPAFPDPDGDAVSYSFAGLPAWLAVYNPQANPRFLYGRPPFTESGPSISKVYWVTVTATDAHQRSASRAFSITVANLNRPPVAPAVADQVAPEGVYAGFAVPRFQDPDSPTLEYTFDGLPGWLTVYNPAANPRYLYGRAPSPILGWFTHHEARITVTARDPEGGSASAAFDVSSTKLRPLPAASRASLTDLVARASVFADPQWYIWCASPIRGPDGTYHLFYSRWRRDGPHAFNGWVYQSEIARAVAERPEGPYVHVETVMQGRGGEAWDAAMVHNPSIRQFDGRYYLYYIGTRDGNDRATDFEDHQYSQRIGVAVADSLQGPWARFDQPLVEPQVGGAVHHYVTNPSVARGPDGRYWMMLKGKRLDDTRQTIHGIAVADSPMGPFQIQPDPLLTDAPAEDSFLWYDVAAQRFFAIFKDWLGQYTGTNGGLGLLESADGATWAVAGEPLVSLRSLRWSDGVVTALANLERPSLLFDACGQPLMLFAAAAQGDPYSGAPSFAVHVPIASDCASSSGATDP